MTRRGRGTAEVLHRVHAAGLLSLVQQHLDGVLHHGAPQFHGLGGEITVDDLPHLHVLGPVMLDEPVLEELPDVLVEAQVGLVYFGVGGPGVPLPPFRGEELRVAGHPDQVLVGGDHPQLVLFVPMDRVLVPQPLEIGIRMVHDLRGKKVVAYCRNHNNKRPPKYVGERPDGSGLPPQQPATVSYPAVYQSTRAGSMRGEAPGLTKTSPP